VLQQGEQRRRGMAREAEPSGEGDCPHFMLKEMHGQGETVASELRRRQESLEGLDGMRQVERVVIVACG